MPSAYLLHIFLDATLSLGCLFARVRQRQSLNGATRRIYAFIALSGTCEILAFSRFYNFYSSRNVCLGRIHLHQHNIQSFPISFQVVLNLVSSRRHSRFVCRMGCLANMYYSARGRCAAKFLITIHKQISRYDMQKICHFKRCNSFCFTSRGNLRRITQIVL